MNGSIKMRWSLVLGLILSVVSSSSLVMAMDKVTFDGSEFKAGQEETPKATSVDESSVKDSVADGQEPEGSVEVDTDTSVCDTTDADADITSDEQESEGSVEVDAEQKPACAKCFFLRNGKRAYSWTKEHAVSGYNASVEFVQNSYEAHPVVTVVAGAVATAAVVVPTVCALYRWVARKVSNKK